MGHLTHGVVIGQMTDNNNDSIWEITIPLTYGVYEFKYSLMIGIFKSLFMNLIIA